MTERKFRTPTNAELIALTRHLREQPDIWALFKRVGFREYLTRDEITFVSQQIPKIVYDFLADEVYSHHDDVSITVGLLERLADGILTDADLEGEWVAGFIADRRELPPPYEHFFRKPTELGWVMALAREVDANPACWAYFEGLTEFEHDSPRDRPLPNPIDDNLSQFRFKHCLKNRYSNIFIYPLLYGKLQGRLDDITDIKSVKRFLLRDHTSEPKLSGGVNLDVYFEDLNR